MKNTFYQYYKKIIRNDFINKFFYKNIGEIPEFKRIILNFGCKSFDLKKLSTSLLALKLITNQKGALKISRKPHILLKLRKGNPVSCVVTLKNNEMYTFLKKLICDSLPFIKNFDKIKINKKKQKKTFSFTLNNLIIFEELELHFYLFRNLPPLNITIITNSKSIKELIFLLQSFKLPTILKAFVTQW